MSYRFRDELTAEERGLLARSLSERLTMAQLVEATRYLMADPKLDDKVRFGGVIHAADWIRALDRHCTTQLFSYKRMIAIAAEEGLTTDDFVMVPNMDDGREMWRRL